MTISKRPDGYSVGLRIKQIREAFYPKLSQLDLAKMIGKSRAQVAHYEGEYSDPPTSVLVKIAAALQVDMSAFFVSENKIASLRRGAINLAMERARPVADMASELQAINDKLDLLLQRVKE